VRQAAELLTLLGRVALGSLFVWAGGLKLLAPAATTAAIGKFGIAAVHLGYVGALVIEIGAGVALVLGWKARAAAAVLALWCGMIAWVAHFHPASAAEITQFLKNLAIAGGLLQFVIHGAGRYSLDRR